MRPALAALADQQQIIDRQGQQIEALRNQVKVLTAGLQSLAGLAGAEAHVASAMQKQADVMNPAQPIPDPPSSPPTQTTQEVKTPEAFANPETPGLIPGSTNDVAADAVSTVFTPGMDVPAPAFKNLVDVTSPIQGTEGPRPLSEVKTLTDVRVGDPMRPEVAFPLQGPFANRPTTGSLRTMASIRLARLRLQAGIAQGDDLAVAAEIEKDASLSDEALEREISTLNNVVTASRQEPRQVARNLVPKAASAQGVGRTVPSLQPGQSLQATAAAGDDDTRDADLFD